MQSWDTQLRIEVAAARKHKDPKCLLGYLRKDDDDVPGSVALKVFRAIKKRGRDFSTAGVEFDTDKENEVPVVVVDKLVVNNNGSTNNNTGGTTKKMNFSDGKNQINFTFNLFQLQLHNHHSY